MITIRIVTPQGLYKETKSSIINAVTSGGEIGILPNHLPIAAILKPSRLRLIEDGRPEQYEIEEGLLYFKENHATVLTSSVKPIS